MVSSNLLKKTKTTKAIFSFSGIEKKEFELKINTDSRKFQKNETFVGLVGESFDGYSYLESVLNLEARAVVVTYTKEREIFLRDLSVFYPNVVFILVTDTLKFIQELASLHIREWQKADKKRVIVGVTGSNGKTTHKEMIYHLLNAALPNKVLATSGNLNNHIGVPLTIFRLTNKHQVAIIEMGMNHAGEIKVLCDIAMPDAGMITNIGAAHIEFLKSMDNIFKEKGTLYRSVMKKTSGKGVFVVNADDEYLKKLPKTKGLKSYGEVSGDVPVVIKAPTISFKLNDKEMLITNKNISEHHNLKNLMGTTLFALSLFPEKTKKIIQAANDYEQPSMNRSQWIETIFLDAYNANPSSMRVSLNSFVNVLKDKNVAVEDCYFILGDMNELGDHAEKMHKEIAEHLKDLGIKHVSFIGRYKEFYKSGYANPESSYLKKEEFYPEWKEIRKKYKYIFIKASRSLQLETLMGIF